MRPIIIYTIVFLLASLMMKIHLILSITVVSIISIISLTDYFRFYAKDDYDGYKGNNLIIGYVLIPLKKINSDYGDYGRFYIKYIINKDGSCDIFLYEDRIFYYLFISHSSLKADFKIEEVKSIIDRKLKYHCNYRVQKKKSLNVIKNWNGSTTKSAERDMKIDKLI